MKQNNYKIQVNNYTIRHETLRGADHIVVPVIMMLEGVHHGSRGPLLHTSEELSSFTASWNGIPVIVYHPEIDGEFVSANLPEIVDSQVAGTIFNARFESGKLKAEAWIDVNRISKISPMTMQMIEDGLPLEVSIGVFSDEEVVEGDWNGEHYTAIAHNYRPDHLALLPDQEGACNWNDGCGIRVNNKGDNMEKEQILSQFKKADVQFIDANKKVLTPCEAMKRMGKQGMGFLNTNETGFIEVREKVQRILDGMDGSGVYHYISELFETDFVYRQNHYETGKDEFFRQSYTTDVSGNIEFTGDATPVYREVSYKSIESIADNIKNQPTNNKKEGATMKVSDKDISFILQSKHTVFDESDKDIVSTFSQALVDKYKVQIENGEKAELNANTTVTEENVKEIIAQKFSTNESFLGLLPTEIKESVEKGLKAYKKEVEDVINHISTNSKAFTVEELNAKDLDELRKLDSMIQETTGNYSLEVPAPTVNKSGNGVPVLIPVNLKSKE